MNSFGMFPVLQSLLGSQGGFAMKGVLLAVILVAGLIALFVSRYKRCPANKILVISGKTGGANVARTLSGGGAFVLPVLQEYAFLSTRPMQIDVNLTDALSLENIRVKVPSVFTVAIGTDSEVMQNAAVRLLGLTPQEIMKQAEDIIFGQLRQVIASMRIEEINRDRETFLKNVEHALEPELKKIGLVLINVNIKDLNDESGYIEAIGQKAAAEAIQKARGDVAEQEKMGEVRVANAQREKDVAVSEATRLREVGIRQNERDKAVQIAEMDRDQQIAEQRAAFEREAQVATADQERRVRVAGANAEAVKGETAAKAEIADAEASLAVRQATAFRQGETSKREAQAAVSEAEHRAQARAAAAQAERIEAERRAQLEAPAKAEKAKKIVEAEAEAEQRRLIAQAEADAIFLRLEAEARGEFEMLAKRGEGLGKIVEACGGADEAFRLMMIEQIPLLAETAAKAISNIKFDKVMVWDNGNGGGKGGSGVANFLNGLGGSLPPMMQLVQEVGGVKMPEYFGRLLDEGKQDTPVAAEAPSEAAETAAKQ